MSHDSKVREIIVHPDLHEKVSFSVLCRPESGVDLDLFIKQLNLRTVEKLRPTPATRKQVMEELRQRGFEVERDHEKSKSPNPLVTANGTVELFEATFKIKLEKHIRRADKTLPSYLTEWFETFDSKAPLASEIPGALQISLPRPPTLLAPRLPIGSRGASSLRVPGDIAQLTRASLVQRMQLSSGDRATGGNVRVAVIDTGFYRHPFYNDWGYRITRDGTPGGSSPDIDDDGHGTEIIANVFACAPDVDLYGIKLGTVPTDALDAAMARFADVISISLMWTNPGSTLRPDVLQFWFRILTIVSAGTVVVVAAGDGNFQTFPAMVPDVIATGGVEISAGEAICVWSGSTSFTSTVFPGRNVPDFCGVASEITLPTPSETNTGDPGDWDPTRGTSSAAPQIAGICALLLQKNPALTPWEVKNRLFETATDVTCGKSASGDAASKGIDRATGAGLVDAFCAWQSVSE